MVQRTEVFDGKRLSGKLIEPHLLYQILMITTYMAHIVGLRS